MNCTPQSLIEASACWDCIPPGMQGAVQTMLMCEWREGGSGEICDDPVVLDWLQRLADDYQPMPSVATINAVCDFCEALSLYGIMDKMLVVNPIIPDSFLAMRYPLIWQPTNGFSPFINHNFVAADLDVNGLLGDGATTYMDTGFIPDDHWTDTDSAGITVYEALAGIGAMASVDCGLTGTAATALWMQIWDGWSFISQCWSPGAQLLRAEPDTPAFYSVNRTSDILFRGWQENSAIPLNLLATNIANEAGQPIPDVSAYFMAENVVGIAANFSDRTNSFVAIHEGLEQGGGFTEVEDFFDAVQTLRITLGGGWV